MKIKIGYFADGPWSHLAFQKIICDNEIEIKFICVRYDTLDDTLKRYCKEYKIDYLRHKNINSIEFLDITSTYDCDLFVSMSFNQIFKTQLINLPKYKTINCHAGKLPFYRGRNVLNWVLINDEKDFGITVHYIDEGIDTGDIILQKTYPITDKDTYMTLLDKAYVECANVLYDAICLFKAGGVKGEAQQNIHSIGMYCTQRKLGDEVLNWNQSSREIFNFIRAICSPGPQAHAYINDVEMKINKVELIPDAPTYKGICGAVLHKSVDSFIVKTRDSFIKVVEFDYDGKLKIGDRFNV
ncbi:methionyl-tRNA formyltransferase [Cysteiniphilum halobium]|uniref:methionyl-tRNA formyltransferase n=1 Tax=Cysteiniphilum halobium TaxID=2219059 RepID=UPI003F86988A